MMESANPLKIEDVKLRLSQTLKFIVPYLPLANAHASDFITFDHWNFLLPTAIQQQLLRLTDVELKNLPFEGHLSNAPERSCSDGKPVCVSEEDKHKSENQQYGKGRVEGATAESISDFELDNSDLGTDHASKTGETMLTDGETVLDCQLSWKHISVEKFCLDAHDCSLENCGLTVNKDQLLDKVWRRQESVSDVFVSTFMNKKKSHEVEMMSQTCAALARATDCQLVVDFGSGKGYLGNHLYLQYNLPVLGIDAAATNTTSAERRMNILEKQWDGLTRQRTLAMRGENLTKREKKQLRKTATGRHKQRVQQEAVKPEQQGERNNDAVVNPEGTGKEIGQAVNSSPAKNCDKTFPSYIPVTTFIDSRTDFIELAKSNFPDMFEHLSDDKHADRKVVEPVMNEPNEIVVRKCLEKLTVHSNDITDINSGNQQLSNIVRRNDVHVTSKQLVEGEMSDCESSNGETVTFQDCDVNTGNTTIYEQSQPSQSSHTRKIQHDGRKCFRSIRSCRSEATVGHVYNTEGTGDYNAPGDPVRNAKDEKFGILLTGLHTCGDLASTTLNLFLQNPQIETMCSVGCCYHLLTEEFLDNHETGSEPIVYGFPKSQCLKELRISLGNTSRNLASQSIHRVTEFEELQGKRFFPRALLGELVNQVCASEDVTWKGLRGLEQKCSSIQEYLSRACGKLGIGHKVNSDLLEGYISRYRGWQQRLAAFFQLRVVLAPCIEALVILDRVCFLLEQNVPEVYLVRLFDPLVSPRCYGIVASKTSQDSD